MKRGRSLKGVDDPQVVAVVFRPSTLMSSGEVVDMIVGFLSYDLSVS